MFGLIGHSTSFEDAKRKASLLGFDHIADGDLDVWCTAPPQLVENVEVKSATGISIEGSYIDSCFVPEMLSRFKTARRKVLNAMELAQKKGINITALGGFTSIIFENLNFPAFKISSWRIARSPSLSYMIGALDLIAPRRLPLIKMG